MTSLTRRGFLASGAIAAAVGGSTRAGPAAAVAEANRAERGVSSGAYLHAAQQTARWIRSATLQKPQGTAWLPDPDHPEKLTTVGPDNSIYSGSAGTVLFFLELAQVTGDESYLQDARRGADYLAATWDRNETVGFAGPFSFDGGLPGAAFSLTEVWKTTGDQAYGDAVRAATRSVVSAARRSGSGVEWSGTPGIAGDGGTILFLLYAAHALGDKSLLALAKRAGDRILEQGQVDSRGGLRWQGIKWPQGKTPPGVPQDAWFPNFELGTAGVGYVLARLYEETHRAEFLTGARAAAIHIQNIATVSGDAALVHYREPDLTDLYYLGYCHGPAGTARLFYQLHKVTGEAQYLEWTENLARGVLRSGIPEKLTPGFWNVACQCCGSAAVVDFFLSLWTVTGKAEYRDFALRVSDQLVSRATDLDGKGYRWYQAWTRVKPWEVNAETGYKIGASGIGAALIHAELAARNRYRALLFPDNPFPRGQSI